MAAPDLSLIITAYNESAIIINNVDELALWMGEHCAEISFEIVVVNDGSSDDMGALLDDASSHRR